jgi:antitoxin component YwqK of YwqJK toxin-antitoxin module
MTSCSASFDELQYNDTKEGLFVYQDNQPFTGTASYYHGRVQMDVENGVSQGVKFYNRRGNLSLIYRQQKTRSYFNEDGQEINRAKFHHLFSKDLEEMNDLLYYVNNIIKENHIEQVMPVSPQNAHHLSSAH